MQLDLFRGEVLVFPVARTLEVGRMARFLLVVQGDRADRYFARVCRKMATALRRCGASEARIQSEIDGFTRAVQGELVRLTSPAAAMEGVA